MADDPVCGMTVDEKKAAVTAVYQREKFVKSPEQYLGGKG